MDLSAPGHDDTRDVTLAVLAGGEGSRMGRAKGELELGDGRPVLEYLLDRWFWPGPTLLVTAPGREHPPSWRRFTREVADPLAGEGPLRGVMTALEHTTTELVVIAAVDMPNIESEHLTWLARVLCSIPDLLGVMFTRPDDVNGEDRVTPDVRGVPGVPAAKLEPLPLALRAAALPWLARRHADGRRSLHSLADDAAAVARVPAPSGWPDETWLNVNRPDDWRRFLAGRAGRH